MMSDDIKVICKRCGRPAKASEYVLDPDYKMMVCSACSKERLSMGSKKKQEAFVHSANETAKPKETPAVQKNRPAGWDEEDERLEKMSKSKASAASSGDGAPQMRVERVDENNVKVTCPKCDYKFTYNLIRMGPNTCPYCSAKLNIKVR